MAIGATSFPTALDDATTLIRAADSARTTLTGAHSNSITTLTVASTSLFPVDGVVTVVKTDGSKENISYTGKSATTFTGCTRGFDGSTPLTFVGGEAVERRLIARDHAVLAEAIIALETKIGIGPFRATGGLTMPPEAAMYVKDEFIAGNNGNGTIGDLGWTLNGGTHAQIATELGHPGLFRSQTSTTITTLASLYLGSAWHKLHSTDLFDSTWVVRLDTNDSDTKVRIGFMSDPNTDTPTHGVYVEKLAADTNWFLVTRASGAQTRSAALIAASTNWLKVRIRRVDASNIGVSVNGGTEVIATTTLPNNTVVPVVQIHNATAVNKTITLDFMDMLVTGLAR